MTSWMPRSPTAIGGEMIVAPLDAATSAVLVMSSVARYIFQVSLAGMSSPMSPIPPAMSTPSRLKMKYPPNSGSGSLASHPNSSP